jgi:hypothetical protein
MPDANGVRFAGIGMLPALRDRCGTAASWQLSGVNRSCVAAKWSLSDNSGHCWILARVGSVANDPERPSEAMVSGRC